MNLKNAAAIAALASVLSLTGCAIPHGPSVPASTVGQIQAAGGSIGYARTTPQVSGRSMSAADEALAQYHANNSVMNERMQSAEEKQKELDAQQEQRLVARKCQMVIEVHYTALRQNAYNEPTRENLNALNKFHRQAMQYFNKCVRENSQEAK